MGFIKSKLKHLGLPWLIITATALPVMDFIHYSANHIKQSPSAINFIEYWLLCMKKTGGFYTGWMDMPAYYYMIDNFYQRCMWFIFSVAAFLHCIRCIVQPEIMRSKTKSTKIRCGVFKTGYI
jgi:hypothetical protein